MKQANTKSELEDILTHFSRLAKMRSSSPDSWQVLLDSLLAWHQQELERAVAEVKETHKHNYHLGEFSGQKLVFNADGSSSHWEYASAHFVCDCGDFKYVLDKKEGK